MINVIGHNPVLRISRVAFEDIKARILAAYAAGTECGVVCAGDDGQPMIDLDGLAMQVDDKDPEVKAPSAPAAGTNP